MKINAKKGLLAVLLSATTLTSCGSISEKNIKVSEIRNVLSTVDDLTEIDEQLETVKMEKYEQLSKNEFKDCSYDFKIEDLDYPGKPENTKYYAIDDMSFKIDFWEIFL